LDSLTYWRVGALGRRYRGIRGLARPTYGISGLDRYSRGVGGLGRWVRLLAVAWTRLVRVDLAVKRSLRVMKALGWAQLPVTDFIELLDDLSHLVVKALIIDKGLLVVPGGRVFLIIKVISRHVWSPITKKPRNTRPESFYCVV
jgi:hypothetical protein